MSTIRSSRFITMTWFASALMLGACDSDSATAPGNSNPIPAPYPAPEGQPESPVKPRPGDPRYAEGTAYQVTSVDGRPLPAIVDIARITLDDGRVIDILTRLDSGIVHLGDRYEVTLHLAGIEREEIDGRIVHRDIGRTREYDRGEAIWNFLDATARLESAYIGGLTHAFLSLDNGTDNDADNGAHGGPHIRFRFAGTDHRVNLGLTLPPHLRP